MKGKTAPSASRRVLIAIDVTPVQTGSENGGAKGLLLALLEGFAAAGQHRYLLLTSEANHDHFVAWDARGFERLCLTRGRGNGRTWWWRLRRALSQLLRRVRWGGPLEQHGADLLFCPFTDPIVSEPGVPTVSLVYDLQHLAYPEFFVAAEREHRDAFFNRVKQSAAAVVCISEFTRSEVILRLGIEASRVKAVPIAIHHRLRPVPAETVAAVRDKYGLGDAPFAFYPANGWPHKNHRLLLVAFARLLRDRPDLPLHLALVGNLLDAGQELKEAVERMGLTGRVHLLGFVPEEDFAALWRAALCLVYPSLYEGFGIPVVEAMQVGIPVICSRTASLPEVGGDAVRYVDPTKPGDIAGALEELYDRPALRQELIANGTMRIARFNGDEMVARYLQIFDDVLEDRGRVTITRVDGVFSDRWLGPAVTAVTGPSPDGRVWSFDVSLPDWYPHRAATIRAELNGRRAGTARLARGARRQVTVRVPPLGGRVSLRVTPAFVPGTAGDLRELTVQLVRGELRDAVTGDVIHEF